MSIGADLAEARHRAGLTLTQVSQRTCIRETIIQSIEHDDYATCGGNFYARGHIRAIANAVGADPKPLIGAYDTAHPAPVVPAADIFEPAMPVKPVRAARRHGLAWAVALGLVLAAAVGFVAFRVIPGSGHPSGATAGAAAGVHRPVAVHRHHHPAQPAAAPVPRVRRPYAHKVAIRLRAIEDCWVLFTTRGGAFVSQSIVVAGTSRDWAFKHAVDMTLGNPGGVRLTVDGKRPLRPGPASPVTLRLGLHSKISR